MNQNVTADPDITQGEAQPESIPPGYVPQSRLNEVIGERDGAREALARSQGEIAGRNASTTPEQPQPQQQYTRAQLTTAVEAGDMSQEAADRFYDGQTEARIIKNARAEAVELMKTAASEKTVGDEMARYRTAKPDIAVAGTDDRNKVEKEYAYLTEHGSPKTPQTELAACRAAFGDVNGLGKKGTRETHQETGGSGDSSGEKTNHWDKGMPAKNKQYYESQIAKGRMTEKSAQELWAGYTKSAA